MVDQIIRFVLNNLFILGTSCSCLLAGCFLTKRRKSFSSFLIFAGCIGLIMLAATHPAAVASLISSARSVLAQSASSTSGSPTVPVHVTSASSLASPHPKQVHPTPVLTKVAHSLVQPAHQVAQVAPAQNPFTQFATSVSKVCGLGFLAIIAIFIMLAVMARRRNKGFSAQSGNQLTCSKCNQRGVAVQEYWAGRTQRRLLCNDCAANLHATLAVGVR